MSVKLCPAQWAVAGTMRQYWMCDLRAGHTGEHVTFWGETSRVRSRHPGRPALSVSGSAPVQGPGAEPVSSEAQR